MNSIRHWTVAVVDKKIRSGGIVIALFSVIKSVKNARVLLEGDAMILSIPLVLLATLLFCSVQAWAGTGPIVVFSTGVTNDRTLLPMVILNPHCSLILGPGYLREKTIRIPGEMSEYFKFGQDEYRGEDKKKIFSSFYNHLVKRNLAQLSRKNKR